MQWKQNKTWKKLYRKRRRNNEKKNAKKKICRGLFSYLNVFQETKRCTEVERNSHRNKTQMKEAKIRSEKKMVKIICTYRKRKSDC